MKKLWFLLLLLFIIFWFWLSFADVIEPGYYRVPVCVMLENVEIDNYRVVAHFHPYVGGLIDGNGNDIYYEPNEKECLEWLGINWTSALYLLKQSVDINNSELSETNDDSIFLSDVLATAYINHEANLITKIYRVVGMNWKYELEIVDEYESLWWDILEKSWTDKSTRSFIDLFGNNRLIKFLFARLLTVLVETIVLFIIAKLFRKNDPISNWRLLLIWILASTITLPLLRFVFPLFIRDGVEYTIIWELSITLIEIFIIKYWLKVSRGKAILASIACNLCSYLLGILIF